MDNTSIILKRAQELQSRAARSGIHMFTHFLDPAGQAALSGMRLERGVFMSMWSGYADAERKVAAFYTDNPPEQADFPISAVYISLPEGHGMLHRNVLGSVMGLGIKREHLGDIVVAPSGAALFCGGGIARYIVQNLLKVGNINVKPVEVLPSEVKTPPVQMKVIRGTVASARLDAVMSLATRKSRGQAAAEIAGGAVNVNFKQVLDPSHRLKTGDIVSCRGFGRFEYAGDGGVTKKGRLAVTVRIYV